MEIFATRLRTEREKLKKHDSKWTQNYMAHLLGVARSTYTAYETGSKVPPLETVNKIADILNVSADYLLGRTDDPSPPGINRAFYNLDDLTDEQKELIYKQIEIFKKLKAESKRKK